ncbi:atrial natriuretic peptide receptor A [Paragonimus westermani]|uniref:guanylate cyclase n=1 Tax=Paragonimus westermani TaxID=34504 RepID=A0A5J4NXM1_9TREM|nr:atrial natriuretic peptide receptor A [Paragonimus westermani]
MASTVFSTLCNLGVLFYKKHGVSILCVDPASVRYIMLKAQELGLINGEYVFINIDLFSTSERLLRPWYQEDASPEENERARNAYRALMTIALRRVNSDAYMEFSNNVRDRSVRDYQTEYGESEVRTVVALFHDAVKLYTDALQDAYTQGIPISQGKTITQLMWNRTVEGVIGKMRIDSNGDRNADYSLLDLDLKSNTFQPVATYLGADRSMHPIPGRQIDWVNERNEPPPGVPVCGFDGSGCQHRHFLIIGAVGAVLFCLFVIVATTLGVYFYRRAELQAISWIIDWSDLEFPDKKTVTKQSLLDDVDANDAPFTSPGAGDASLANVEGQTVSFGDVPTSPVSVGGGNEQMFCVNNELAPHKPPRRSIFHKASTSSSGDIAGSGNVAVVPPSHSVVDKRKTINTSVSLQSSDEPATQEVVEEASLPYSTVRRFQQRWVRRHRLSEDNSSTSPNLSEHATANAAMLNHRAGTKPQTEPLYYMKSPSFDYSSITAKPRTMGARKKTDAGEAVFRSYCFIRAGNNTTRGCVQIVTNRLLGSTADLINLFVGPFPTLHLSSCLLFMRAFISISVQTDVTPILEAHSGRRKKDSQVSRHSAELPAHGQATKLHGTMAMYKGSKVFLRPVRRQNRIESNKETAVEINKIKDLNNDHICRLIGVCLETSRQCFVLEYCPKGSLFDFLKKEQFTMDWMFKLSVMQDICRGMAYLHQIPVPHGHLKSSNCLFDSRFAVKVTDFGLPRIRGPNCQKYDYGTPAYYRNLFWTAPELIPVKESDSPAATFKADVYAYAIICQEIIYRKGPFYVEEETQPEPIVSAKSGFRMVPRNAEDSWLIISFMCTNLINKFRRDITEIITAVQDRQTPCYRPALQIQEEGSEEVIQMIRKAWDDDPNKRPDFRMIGKTVGSDSSENLIDNLLERMQGITTNLEAMVDKRTSQYMDEKKRAEDLLYSMLPK